MKDVETGAELNFLGLAQRNRSQIAKGFTENFGGETGKEISKGIEYIKSGKEVSDSIKARMKKIEETAIVLRDRLKTLRKQIGMEPDNERSYYSSNGDDELSTDGESGIKYPAYTIDWRVLDGTEADKPVSTMGMNTVSQPAGDKTKEQLKQKHNDWARKLCRLEDMYKEMGIVQKNVIPGKKYQLDKHELMRYGFGQVTGLPAGESFV